ncbi:hypothetical protein IW22_01905 [Chryseobacterium sp. JM1]|nr:hypothetical protein IW22_01905 [Chryseobacterium sp. JM1]
MGSFFIVNHRFLLFQVVNQNGPQSRRPKNTNDEKNLFRKIQTEFVDSKCLISFFTVFLPVREIVAVTPKVRFMIDFFKNHITSQNNEH